MSERDERHISGRELLLILAFWTFIATLTAMNRLLDPRGFGFRLMSPAAPIVLVYIESYIWALLTPLVFWLAARYAVERTNWMTRVTMLVGSGIVIAILVDQFLEVLRRQMVVMPRRAMFLPWWRDVTRLRFLNQLLVYLAVL